jgi:hypothetical protein
VLRADYADGGSLGVASLPVSEVAFVASACRCQGSNSLMRVLRRTGYRAESRLCLWREFGRRVVAGERIRIRRLQLPGQQLVDAGDWMFGDAREHLAQKRFGIVAVEFGGPQQAVDCRSTITACITAGEQIVLALMKTFP